MKEFLRIDWTEELRGLSVQETANCIERNITEAVVRNVPTITFAPNSSRKNHCG